MIRSDISDVLDYVIMVVPVKLFCFTLFFSFSPFLSLPAPGPPLCECNISQRMRTGRRQEEGNGKEEYDEDWDNGKEKREEE